MRMTVWEVILAGLLLLALAGHFRFFFGRDSTVRAELMGTDSGTLFVWIHGYTPSQQRLDRVASELGHHGSVLRISYPAQMYSDADAQEVSAQIDKLLEREISRGRFSRVVLVAHSVGALLARRTLLDGVDRNRKWVSLTKRVVLLAGANRGWNSGGEKPADLGGGNRLLWHVGEWGARLTGWGTFILQFQAGTPFVADLRLDWMRKMRNTDLGKSVEVIQLLGDIDDVVSSDDSADLRVMASEKYAFLRVRGTGHGDIIDLPDSSLGNYRRDKILLAATHEPFSDIHRQSEEQPLGTDDSIRTVVFVLHGIRDLGRWSSEFETELRGRLQGSVRIVSPRYGYLGMGPFLLPTVRDRYVRWLMDEYTETLARYPMLEPNGVRFFGHSNGTYLLADALARYPSMKIDRVVFAGSVVPRGYDWKAILARQQVSSVRNYVGTGDWVVALFPRLFESTPLRWLGNRLGGAGYEGFDAGGGCDGLHAQDASRVNNVCYVKGEHSAFEGRVTEIVSFLIDETPAPARVEERSPSETLWLSRPIMWLVWIFLVSAAVYVGVRVVLAAPTPAWLVLVLYVLLVIRTLQTA